PIRLQDRIELYGLHGFGCPDRRLTLGLGASAREVVPVRLPPGVHGYGAGGPEIVEGRQVLSECHRLERPLPVDDVPPAPTVRADREPELLWNSAKNVEGDHCSLLDRRGPEARHADRSDRCRVPESTARGLRGVSGERGGEDARR